MDFILNSGWEDGVADLTQRLAQDLAAGKNVLWLVSGGSNIRATIDVMSNISSDLSQHLSVMLADERYGAPGHPDSNWAQLFQAGFDPGRATLYPVLDANLSFEGAAQHYTKIANQAIAENDIIIAQLGIGTDCHIAGILPDSPAAHQQQSIVSAYEASPYKRLTLTFPALLKIDAAYAFAFGAPKQEALKSLHNGPLNIVKQPAQILRQIKEAYIYNDQIGDRR